MNNNAAYIIPNSSIQDPNTLKVFENFTFDDTKFLKATLYLNLIDNFLTSDSKTDFYFIMDEHDREYLLDDFRIANLNFLFTDLTKQKLLFEKLSDKEFTLYKNNIILSADLIGINVIELNKCFNLLNIDDETLLIGKSKEGQIGIFGFNTYSNITFDCLIKSNFLFNDFLGCTKTISHFIHTLNDILLINNIDNFKQMYFELSQKKSIEYCSQHMHERFTHLFVEYKDLLK